MQVVIVSHHPGQQEKRNQQRTKKESSPCESPIVPHQISGNRHHQTRRREADPQLPRPEHEVEMILAANFTPHREDRLDGNEKFDDQQRAEKAIVHVRGKVSICELTGCRFRLPIRI
jgi:hypothetical protein